MAFAQRAGNPTRFSASPLLPQADSSQGHDIPTGVSPTTAKLQDWVAGLDVKVNIVQNGSVLAAGTDAFAWADPTPGPSELQESTLAVQFNDAIAGDVIEVSFTGNVKLTSTTSDFSYIQIVAIEDYGGAGTVVPLEGRVDMYGSGGLARYPGVSIRTRRVVVTPGDVRLQLRGFLFSGSGDSMSITGSWSLTATRINA